MSLQEIKLSLIQAIVNSDSVAWLQRVEQLILQERDPLAEARQPAPETLSIQDLKHAQGYDGAALTQWLRTHDPGVWADEDFEQLLQLT